MSDTNSVFIVLILCATFLLFNAISCTRDEIKASDSIKEFNKASIKTKIKDQEG